MDQAGQYTNRHTNLFHSSHLPPPSALQLPPPSSYTLPPLSNLSPPPQRFPPQQPPPPRTSHLPTYSSSGSVLPPLPSPAGSLSSWPNVHRTSNRSNALTRQ
ncbi:hypothetical protein BDN71DRAFT_966487 [Pleurotus eryngii]|uniref:Uncharacterized protein n=1 Tax=Pleurotus eryngii TaxID=5323 RepID=A0A9P6A8R3_PLEER|nr:hypothetical protein BDN71DRAFT_966487 [Pleurotus eryngii]